MSRRLRHDFPPLALERQNYLGIYLLGVWDGKGSEKWFSGSEILCALRCIERGCLWCSGGFWDERGIEWLRNTVLWKWGSGLILCSDIDRWEIIVVRDEVEGFETVRPHFNSRSRAHRRVSRVCHKDVMNALLLPHAYE